MQRKNSKEEFLSRWLMQPRLNIQNLPSTYYITKPCVRSCGTRRTIKTYLWPQEVYSSGKWLTIIIQRHKGYAKEGHGLRYEYRYHIRKLPYLKSQQRDYTLTQLMLSTSIQSLKLTLFNNLCFTEFRVDYLNIIQIDSDITITACFLKLALHHLL